MDKLKKLYRKHINPDYGFHIASELTKFVNSDLGGRQAGSDAEHSAATWLYEEMKKIGLFEIKKEAFSCDKWQFNGSTLKILKPENVENIIMPYAYPSGGTTKEGINAELIYLEKGTCHDYDTIDAKGKIVLIDIDMAKDWWITLPVLEAELQGAAAIINSCSGSYAQKNKHTMNSQNFAGPISIPSVNINRHDAELLKNLLQHGQVKINLTVNNLVAPGGTSHNITGKIPGKQDDEYIIVGAHYDCHFWGFQDDNCGVAAVLTTAKALIDSNYQPERTLIFILHGAEEWGAIDSPYDFAIGAWHQVFTLHPEWCGKSIVFINFEHPAHSYGDVYYANATPELNSFVKSFYDSAPETGGLRINNFANHTEHITTDTDSWSYAISGIPCIVNGRKPLSGNNEYYKNIYHSNFDTMETYEKDIFLYNLEFYGLMAIELDQQPVLPLDFNRQAERLLLSIQRDTLQLAGIDPEPFLHAVDSFRITASEAYTRIQELNGQYAKLKESCSNSEELKKITVSARIANNILLSVNKIIFDVLYKIDFKDNPIFGHEHTQKNILLLSEAIEKLKNGNATHALESSIEKIDNNYHARYFSEKPLIYLNKTLFEPSVSNRLFWAKGKIVNQLILFDTVRSLALKISENRKEYDKEIKELTGFLNTQKIQLSAIISEEIEALKKAEISLRQILCPNF